MKKITVLIGFVCSFCSLAASEGHQIREIDVKFLSELFPAQVVSAFVQRVKVTPPLFRLPALSLRVTPAEYLKAIDEVCL